MHYRGGAGSLTISLLCFFIVGLHIGCSSNGSDVGLNDNGEVNSEVQISIPQELIDLFIDGSTGNAIYTDRFTETTGNSNVTIESA